MRVETWISNGGSSAKQLGFTPSPVTRERAGERGLLTFEVNGNSLRSPPSPAFGGLSRRRERHTIAFANC